MKYTVVTTAGRYDFDNEVALSKWAVRNGYNFTGTHLSTRTRAELQGAPKFFGLYGPMYDGPGVIRYETPQAYEELSK